ncbi:methionyl-tRNA formyltransferase [bacterium]|nr:methionyl-tRNA formyltransferase [bacterium]
MDKYQFTKRVLFIGVPDMAYMGLDMLLYSGVNIVGVVGPVKTHNTYVQFRNYVKYKKLNFIEYETLSSPEFIETINALKPDIAVVCSFNQKFPKELIDAVPDGIINIHPSLLPKYRGGNPYSWVIINGEKQTGVTLHFISENFDEGDIIAQEIYEIAPNETMGTIFNRTNMIGCRMLLKALLEYDKTGLLPRKQQPAGEFIKAPNIKDNEMFLNYNKPAEELVRLVRGLNPYFSAMTIYKGQIMKIHKASACELQDANSFANGEVCKVENDKFYIKTERGCLCPEVVQYSGYFIGDASDFVNVANPQLGDKFTYG